MRVPARLEPLVEVGVIDDVVRPLLAGKEAAVYLVRSGEELRVAKVYKEASHRSFRQRAEYTEGRRVKNSRSERAMKRKSKFGRAEVEAAWRTAEVDVIYRLRAAGVRVPEPYDFVEGVLVMELIHDGSGGPAPRLVDVQLERREAEELHSHLIRETQRMLCAGVVHGDLSDFNVLIGQDGPVIIDFPQAVDPANNRNAKKLLLRDVKNLTLFLGRFAPSLRKTRFGPEMWALYEQGELEPETQLTGRFQKKESTTDVEATLWELRDVEKDMLRRLGVEFPEDRRGGRGKKRSRAEDDHPAADYADEDFGAEPQREPGRRRRGGRDNGGRSPEGAGRTERGEAGRGDRRGGSDAPRGDAPDGQRRRRKRSRSGSRGGPPGASGGGGSRGGGSRDGGSGEARSGGGRSGQGRSGGGRSGAGRSGEGRSGGRGGGPAGGGDTPRPGRSRRSRRGRGRRRGGSGGPPKGPEVVVKGDRSRNPRKSRSSDSGERD